MSWLENHSESEKFASLADLAFKKGDISKAEKMFKQAAEFEEKALFFVDLSKKKTIGIMAVSVVALYFKGKDFEKAKYVAYKWLAHNGLPEFAVIQLKEMVEKIGI